MLRRGDLIDAAEIGLLATVGAATIKVWQCSLPPSLPSSLLVIAMRAESALQLSFLYFIVDRAIGAVFDSHDSLILQSNL